MKVMRFVNLVLFVIVLGVVIITKNWIAACGWLSAILAQIGYIQHADYSHGRKR